jgi:hypothetical protein
MVRSNQPKDCEVAKDAATSILPAGTPDWITPQLIDETIRVWQPYYAEILSPEEAITMIRNVGRLYQALSSGSAP